MSSRPAMIVVGVWKSSVSIGVGHRRERQCQCVGDLQDVRVAVGLVEHEDLFAVVGTLDDGKQVVLALGEEPCGYPDVVNRMVDPVEADPDPRTGHQDVSREACTPR